MKKLLALTLSLLMVFAMVPASALTLDLPEAGAEAAAVEDAAELSESIKETVDTVAKTGDLGELIWFEDFERFDINYNAPRVAPAYISPTYESPYQLAGYTLNDMRLSYSGIAAASVQADPNDADNRVLYAKKGSTYGIIDLQNSYQLLSKPGKYTMELDVMPKSEAMTNFNISYYVNGYNDHKAQGFSGLAAGTWKHLTKTANAMRIYTKEEAAVLGGVEWADSTTVPGAYAASNNVYAWPAYIHHMYTFNGVGDAGTSYEYYLDNIKVWFLEYADITFDISGDAQNALSASMSGLTHRSYVPGEEIIQPNIAGSGYVFNGWVDEGGNPVTTATAGTYTLYADIEAVTGYTIGASESYVEAGKGTVVTVASDGENTAEWTVDVGNTGVTPVINGNTVTLAIGDYAGVITVGATSTEGTVAATQTVIVHSSKVSKPGLNMFNGLPEALTFETNDYTYGISMGGFPGTIAVGDNSALATGGDITNTSARALVNDTGAFVNGDAWYWNPWFSSRFGTDRVHHVYAQLHVDYADDTYNYGHQGWIYNFNGAHAGLSFSNNNNGKAWHAVTYNGTPTAQTSASRFGMKVKSNSDGITTIGDVSYLDNMYIIPDYKITYHYPDGSTETVAFNPIVTAYPLELATEYTIDKATPASGFNADTGLFGVYTGWTTAEGGTTAMTAVPLEYEDIDLYPAGSTENAADGPVYLDSLSTFNVTGSSAVTVNDPYNAVEITDNGTTNVTVTGLGYNGTLTIGNYTVALIGEHNWRPGVNYFTGTPEAYGFERAPLFGINGVQVQYIDNPDKTTGNDSDKVIYFKSGTSLYPSMWYTFNTPIPTERPTLIKMDALGNLSNFWVMINGAGSSDIYRAFDSMFKAIAGNDTSWHTVRYYGGSASSAHYDFFNKIGIELRLETNNPDYYLYFDNLNLTPAYKIDYVDEQGAAIKTEYALLDDNGDFLTEWVPSDEDADYAIDGVTVDADHPYTLNYRDFTVTVTPKADRVLFAVGDKSTALIPEGETFTVPTDADLQISNAKFVTWLDEQGNKVRPGTTVNTADYLGTILTAYLQDKTVPAMGFSYEMNETEGNAAGVNHAGTATDSNLGKVTVTYADGIAVYQNAANQTGADPRLHLTGLAMDASEYYIYSIRERGTKTTKVNTGTLHYLPTGSNYSCTEDGLHGNYDFTVANDEFGVSEVNLLEKTAGKAVHKFGPDAATAWTLNQLWVNLGNETLNGQEAGTFEWEVDYVRMYRGGIVDVYYHDEDGTLLFTDSNRGVGTGYLLRLDAPEKEGFTFIGWEDENGNIYGSTIDLTGDIDLTAKYLADNLEAPVTDTATFSLRAPTAATNGKAALRFKAVINKTSKSSLDEYGFIVSTEARLNGAELTMDLGEGNYLKGAAYIKGEKDLIYDEDEDTITFTAACYGIPSGSYDVDLYARSYCTYTAASGKVTLYGAVATQNIKAQAQKYLDAYNEDPLSDAGKFYIANQATIDALIANVAE